MRLPATLHARMALVSLLLLLTLGVLSLVSTSVTSKLYVQEENQRLNMDLARNIAKMKESYLLTSDGEVRSTGLDELFHWLMVVNPNLQFYVLDIHGQVTAYDQSTGVVESATVVMEPIDAFLGGAEKLPILGDDPRHPDQRQIFSVSPLPHEGKTAAYLYIVLAHQGVDTLADRLRRSYILRLSTHIGVGALLVALLTAFVLFSQLTRPLRQLAQRMRAFLETEQSDNEPAAPRLTGGGEVEILEASFVEMTERIGRQMEEIQRMASTRNELIANVSHDLRTPIASLRGYLETLVLKEGALGEAERREYLQIALKQSERLGSLVEELFELTKLESQVQINLERFKIAELVQDNVQRFHLAAERKGIRLRSDFDPDLPPVFADVQLMERVLENLLENAIRFTPPGGAVTVQLREAPHALGVRVIDTGCGIPDDELPKIFDRFYTRSRSDESSRGPNAGLGLAITRRIVELHGDQIQVDSKPGRGTTFSFGLSIAPRSTQVMISDFLAQPS